MAPWEQLSINKPHLVYIILGGFTTIFMLVSLFVKEKLYIGEATVATICGVIFGPHAANLINPGTWGNTDQITLEFSRVVLVVQCFAVGVELPKAYMERHWKSVVLLLLPVMTFGWLVTSLFIWWMVPILSWLEALAVAACVTATDPVLASSVVGKGKFAKRVPKHLRDLLSAESGCNDGMAFPFIYLALYLIRYNSAREVIFHWTCFSILYECVFGAFYGVMIGYLARHAIRWAERRGIIDRESFLVFYFVLALFCAGSGSLLGMDDLLIGFAAGVGFSNDGWFTEKTEESHVSNVIDLLINLTYFVYLGTIIPWDQYNAPEHGLVPWRLVIIALFVIFFRRIPIMLALKPIIPDIKTWREALFAGHFGPIGVGAIFVAILARAELESESTTPLAVLPGPDNVEYNLIYVIWPIVTFLVISSIIVHGSSVAVFTLGKRINTLQITLSYTQDNEKSSQWMNRLPRISSQSRSMSKMSDDEGSLMEKDVPPGQLPPIGIPKLALRRQKDEDYNEKPNSRSSSLRPLRRRKKKNYGGPISQSAIMPERKSEPLLTTQESGSDTLNEKSGEPSPDDQIDTRELEKLKSEESDRDAVRARREAERETGDRDPDTPPSNDDDDAEVEAFDEGDHVIVEDEEGNVLKTLDSSGASESDKAHMVEDIRRKLAKDHSGKYAKHKHVPHKKNEGEEIEQDIEEAVEHPEKKFRKTLENWKGFGKPKSKRTDTSERGEPSRAPKPEPAKKRGPAHAYQFGNTIIVEDEDGEVIKTYTMPGEDGEKRRLPGDKQVRQGMKRMGTWVGVGAKPQPAAVAAEASGVPQEELHETDDASLKEELERVESRKDKRPGKQSATIPADDDGLRMIISRTDQYGLTGLRKQRPGKIQTDEEIALDDGRRLSTAEFLKRMQRLDPKAKVKQAEASNASEDLVREVKREAHRQSTTDTSLRPSARRFETTQDVSSRPNARRVGTTPINQSTVEEDEQEEAESRARRPNTRQRAQSDLMGIRGRPEVRRRASDDSNRSIPREIPTHDTRSTIARHGQGTTAADIRRQRLSTQFERPDDEDHIAENDEEDDLEDVEDEERETAAEKRRRLAALGMGAGESSDSEESEDEGPRRPAQFAVREPDQSPPPARRIQWGGERGREEQTPAVDDYFGAPSTAGVKNKIKGFFKG